MAAVMALYSESGLDVPDLAAQVAALRREVLALKDAVQGNSGAGAEPLQQAPYAAAQPAAMGGGLLVAGNIMEPYWNEVRIEQVVGRAARTESHSHLPLGERRVEVYRYITGSASRREGAPGAGATNRPLTQVSPAASERETGFELSD